LRQMDFTSNPKDISVVVQGFGNVGSNAAKRAFDLGFKVVGVSDLSGGYYNPKGLNIREMIDYVKRQPKRSLEGYRGGEEVTNEELLELPCDVLIPAALEGQLTGKNAPHVKAKLIVEGANGPTLPEADEIFIDRGITVVPDVLANAGGVTVSYFEWVQGLQEFFWDEDEVYRRLERILVRAFDEVTHSMEKYRVDMRTAAQIRPLTAWRKQRSPVGSTRDRGVNGNEYNRISFLAAAVAALISAYPTWISRIVDSPSTL